MKNKKILIVVFFLVMAGVVGAALMFFPAQIKTSTKLPLPKKKNELYSISEIESANLKLSDPEPAKGLKKYTQYVVPEVGLDDLNTYIQDDDVCNIENSKFTLDDAAITLLHAPDTVEVDAESDKLLLELFNKEGAAPKSPEAENINKFFNALMMGDLFFGSESPEVNIEKAAELLRQLTESDPENGVHNFTLAYLLSQMKAPESEVKAEFRKAFQKPKFEIYSDFIQKRLREKSFSSASHWLIYLTIQERFDELNLAAPTFLLHNYIQKNDPVFNREAVNFAQLMIPSHVKEGIPPSLNNWEKSSYIFGQKILAWAWPSAYPGKPRPEFEPLKRLMVINMDSLDQGTEALRKLKKSGSNFFTCNREFFDVWFTQSKIQELNNRE